MASLSAGVYLGRTIRSRRLDGLELTLCAYEPNRKWRFHTHEHNELVFLVGGEHREQTSGSEFDQPPGSFLVHSTTIPHATRSGPNGMLKLNVCYTPSWLDSRQVELGSHNWRTSVVNSHASRRIAFRLLAATSLEGELISADAENGALEMLSMLGDQVSDRAPKWLFRIIDLINGEFASTLRISNLAAMVGYDPAHVCRTFRSSFRCSISDYIQAIRLGEAIRLIENNVPIGEAAQKTGFYDHAHLCRISRRWLGTSPAEACPTRKESHICPSVETDCVK